MMNKVFSFLCLLLLSAKTQAQEPMAEQFRADGKIYVVLAVISIILLVFFIILFRLDRKIKKQEESLKS